MKHQSQIENMFIKDNISLSIIIEALKIKMRFEHNIWTDGHTYSCRDV